MGGRLGDPIEVWKARKWGGRYGNEETVFDNVTGVEWTGFSEGRGADPEALVLNSNWGQQLRQEGNKKLAHSQSLRQWIWF